MTYFVYMLKCVSVTYKKTYIGYTKDLTKRLFLHNSSKGAKFTKGNKWKIIYKKKFTSKSDALSYEYKIKHDKKKRLEIYNKYK